MTEADFYLASYYHFSYLIGEDYEKGVKLMEAKLEAAAQSEASAP